MILPRLIPFLFYVMKNDMEKNKNEKVNERFDDIVGGRCNHGLEEKNKSIMKQ